MRTLTRLTEIDARYAYVGDGASGDLYAESESGDMSLPPYGGRWTWLERVGSIEDAMDAARAWSEAEGNGRGA